MSYQFWHTVSGAYFGKKMNINVELVCNLFLSNEKYHEYIESPLAFCHLLIWPFVVLLELF